MTDVYEFEEKTHTYKINGKPATGVTTVIGVLAKPALIGWAARMACERVRELWTPDKPHDQILIDTILEEAKSAHTKKKEAAGMHGTDAHALVEEYVKVCLLSRGEPCFLPRDVIIERYTPILKFIEWAAENVDHFLFSERRMFNKELFIAGTADFAYVGKDGKKYMADFKTSSGIYGIDYFMQVAAYKMLAEAEGDEPYDGMTIVRLGKKGPQDFEVQQLFEYETYKEAFLSCLKLYRAQAALKGLVIKQ